MMSRDRKEKLVHTLRWIIRGRWVIVFGIGIVGILQRYVMNVSSIHLEGEYILAILAFAFCYNGIYFLLLRKGENRSEWTLRIMALAQILIDQLIFTIIIYLTGGTESLSFIFYFYPILMATVLYRTIGIVVFAVLNSAFYVTVIILENAKMIPYLARYNFDTGIHGNITANISNTLTVVAAILLAAFFSTYISNMIRDREREITIERDKVNSLLNSLTDGLIMIDPFGKVIALNPQGSKMLQVRSKDVIGRTLTETDFQPELKEFGKYIAQLGDKNKIETREMQLFRAGTNMIYKITTIPVFNAFGKLIGFMKVVTDCTREREIDRMKSDFISVAAHQLRTPLSGVKWVLKMLIDGDMGELSDEQKKFLQRGFQNQERMIHLVNDLLDVSKIEEGKFQFNFKWVQLEDVIEESIKRLEGVIAEKSIQLKFSKLPNKTPKVKIDQEKMSLVIQNIIDNGVKYTKLGGKILVSLVRAGANLKVSVQDSGVGIPKDQQGKIFTKFFRAKNVLQMHQDGSGLGLFIVKNIVETHGGKVGLESEEGKGTKIWFTIPLDEKILEQEKSEAEEFVSEF